MTTYTLDAEKDGQFFEDHGLTVAQIEVAKVNAPRLGITILSITEETAVDVSALRAFGVAS